MPEYLITWKINISAENPLEAAKEARKTQLDKGSLATIFEVSELAIKDKSPSIKSTETIDLED